jgi:hypothetical protein
MVNLGNPDFSGIKELLNHHTPAIGNNSATPVYLLLRGGLWVDFGRLH